MLKDELGTLQGKKVSIHIDLSVPPKFCTARSLPYTMKEKVEAELQCLQGQGIISSIRYSKWATPIVPVLKQDKTLVRICGDYKLAGGVLFTKLDMSQAYLQLTVDDQAKELLTINTHKGLFAYNRLPFGVSSAPGISNTLWSHS